MKERKVIVIEDLSTKYMALYRELMRAGIQDVYWANNAEKGIAEIERAVHEGEPYLLLISDMHFDFFGEDDREAGEKTMNRLRTMGIDIPVIFFSSQNWKIPGAAGNVFYNPGRNWEKELEGELEKLGISFPG